MQYQQTHVQKSFRLSSWSQLQVAVFQSTAATGHNASSTGHKMRKGCEDGKFMELLIRLSNNIISLLSLSSNIYDTVQGYWVTYFAVCFT